MCEREVIMVIAMGRETCLGSDVPFFASQVILDAYSVQTAADRIFV